MGIQLQIMLGDKNLFELIFVLLDIFFDVNLALADFLQPLLDLLRGQVLLFHLHYKRVHLLSERLKLFEPFQIVFSQLPRVMLCHQPAQRVFYHPLLLLRLMTHFAHPFCLVLDSLVDLRLAFV